jgi:hypothetical protein
MHTGRLASILELKKMHEEPRVRCEEDVQKSLKKQGEKM